MKKFRVRVIYSFTYSSVSSNLYVVEYAYYRFFPVYHRIKEYNRYGKYASNMPVTGSSFTMEEFANRFKSIDDVRAWNLKQKEQERRAKNIPYYKKQIL